MKILLVFPRYPDTFWSFKHALNLVRKKAAFPPLGLLTIASMLPGKWEKKLVDLNVGALTDKQIKWADYVFLSAMVVQKDSVRDVVARCNRLGTRVVAGGPLFTTGYDEFTGIDHFVLGEAECTLPALIADMERDCAKPLYSSTERPDIGGTPVPMWSLIKMGKYTSMSLQYSRGCPFDCEFCDIGLLNGHTPRTKSQAQVTAELDALYNVGWRGSVFIVDDNFIGNKKKLKLETLPTIIEWNKKRDYPFLLTTEASINLADDEELMDLMIKGGFTRVFVGIESPSEESLAECNKSQNKNRDLIAAVKSMQNHGLEVMGGFILGFDSDPLSIFRSQINFIQKSGIVTAMVGLLNAPRGTRLYQRLKRENRLLNFFSGDNTDCSLNFIPIMNRETLVNGYMQVLETIYSPKPFYARVTTFLKEYRPPRRNPMSNVKLYQVVGGINVLWTLGFLEKGRRHYWKFLLSNLLRRPRLVPLSIELAVYGHHFRKVAQKFTSLRRAASQA